MDKPVIGPEAFESGLAEELGLDLEVAESDRVEVTVEVDERLHQPFGIMHGGMNLVLAESAASVGGYLASPDGHHAVGVEINANHLEPVRRGRLRAVATPVRLGESVHVWSAEVRRPDGERTAVSRCTLAIRET